MAVILYFPNAAICQNALVFKGTVKCIIANDERSTRGAQNVIVVPGCIPQRSSITGSQGYYQINTGIPIRLLEDKSIALYYFSACKQCVKKVLVFVSTKQARENENRTMSFISVETVKMKAGCKQTELDPIGSDKELNKFISQPGEDLYKTSPANVLTAPPALSNLLIESVAAATPVAGKNPSIVNDTDTFKSGLTNYGRALPASAMILTPNPGFNFSASRLKTEAVFWNPASLDPTRISRTAKKDSATQGSANPGHASVNGAIQVLLNFKNNIKFSAYRALNDRVTLGLGGIYTKQSAEQDVHYAGAAGLASHMQTIMDYSIFLPVAYRITRYLGVAVTAKFIGQSFNLPDKLIINTNPLTNEFVDSTVSRHRIDADLSLSYDIIPTLTLGLNFMNVAGSELYGGSFPLKPSKVPVANQRSLGMGICYRWRRFNFGSDIYLTADSLYEVTSGVNYVPFNNALVMAGYSFRQKSYSLSFKWGSFMITYIDDNGLLKNEDRPGKSKFLNGRIYTTAVVGLP
jgi:hypothetical protein